MSQSRTQIIVTEDPSETMQLATSGPFWNTTVPAWDVAAWNALDALQAAGEAEFGERWAENARRIAAEWGYDADVHVTSRPVRWTNTEDPRDPDGPSVEQQVWQAAHDATDLPEGWA